jgi:hypothetical protein
VNWNHRITVQTIDAGEQLYEVREVYYHDDGSVASWTGAPIDACGYTLDEVRATLHRMLDACDKPVLRIDEDEP